MFGNASRAGTVSLTATFIGLIAAGAWISIPIPLFPAPVTLQTLFVLLAGAVMKRHGFLPVLLYLLLGVAGAPVFHNGTAGIGVLLGPTGGYLVGFVPAAAITGFAYSRRRKGIRIGGLLLATLVVYLFGVGWLVYSAALPLPHAIAVGALPFLPGDLMKAWAVYLIEARIGEAP